MRAATAAFVDQLNNAPRDGLVPRQAVYFTVKERATGNPREIGLWTGEEDLNLTVYSGFDGAIVSRPYRADVISKISDIPRVSDFTIQTVTVDLSQIADAAIKLVGEYEARLGKVEIHDVLIDPRTGDQIGPGLITFLGIIDGAPAKTPRIGGTGSIRVKIVSEVMAMLSRPNPRKSSYEGQKTRDGDEWGKYASTVSSWKIPWGQKKAT
ncbi:hypothetical protein C5748_03825 [Phyllobacterium phragmitis]|uniref:Uncharacterized protein n=1 Tax=Phyllobacterium phragmitis TaxID=2670329 RepID=A0A2S9IXS7_9HYPH|nr:hypothetical protein [Phyllobacterium phragmitis]PRD45334.1 hypothetical protein C5748_03825 [Phyllobacterium phragmitis]